MPYSPGWWDRRDMPTADTEPRTCCPGQPKEQLCEHSCRIQVLPQICRQRSLPI